MGLSVNDLDFFTVGDIYDMLAEQNNDGVEYPQKATQADIRAFFGG